MLKLNRWTTWPFTFKKRASPTAGFDDLNGIHLFLTIKSVKDEVSDDTGAVYKTDFNIATSVTSYTFSVPNTSTLVSPGIYVYGWKWIQGGVTLTADGEFEVLDTTTNRNA